MSTKLRCVMKKALMFHHQSNIDAYSTEDKSGRDQAQAEDNRMFAHRAQPRETVYVSKHSGTKVMMAPVMLLFS